MNNMVHHSALELATINMRNAGMYADWPQPEPLSTPQTTAKPYPVDALGGTLGNATRAIASIVKAPEGLAAHCVLAAAAAMAQRLVNAPSPTNDIGQPASLLLLTVAGSGEGKDSCESIACRPIYDLERAERERYSAEMKSFRKAKDPTGEPPQDPRTVIREATWENLVSHVMRGGKPSMVWFSTEAGAFFGGHSMQSETRMVCVGGLTQAYDDGRFERLRVVDKEGSGSAWERRLSFHLLGQPAVLLPALNDGTLQAQGLLPRFLLACPQSLAGTRTLTLEDLKIKPDGNNHIKALWKRMEEMQKKESLLNTDGGLQPTLLKPQEAAMKAWLNDYNEIEKAQGEGGTYSGILQPFARRTAQHNYRLSAVLAAFDGEGEITENKMRNASQIARYSLESWARLLTTSAADKETADAAKLLAWLQTHQKHRSARQLQREGQKPRPGIKKIRELLEKLEDSGWVRQDGYGFESFVVYGDGHAQRC